MKLVENLLIEHFSYFGLFTDLFYLILFLPLILTLFIFLLPAVNSHKIGVWGSLITFWLTVVLILNYHFLSKKFLITDFNFDMFLVHKIIYFPYSFGFEFSVDSISLIFLFLTSFIFLICSFLAFDLYSHDAKSLKLLYVLIFFMEFFIFLAFFTLSLFFFYIFFEAVLLPMYLIIIIWGSRSRKIKAAYFFFLYTLFFSFFLLYAILILYNSVPYIFFYDEILIFDNFSFKDFYQENFIWFCFFLALAVKVPIFPLHLWLPEAHVEAPTIGSIILASILLKLGGYGFIRFLIPLFPESTIYFRPLVLIFCLGGTIYGAFMASLQLDIKKIVAYSSVSHMNFAILGLFSLTYEGLMGSITLFLSHGFTSAALFFLVGTLYKRFNTRLIKYYGGVSIILPIFTFFFMFFSFSNIGFPGTLNFTSEFLIFFSLISSTFGLLVVFFLLISFILSIVYSIWTFNRISFGTFSYYLIKSYDLNKVEFYIIFTLFFFNFFFGIFSYYLIDFLSFDISQVSYIYKYSK